MALREFIAPDGEQWRVWQVIPTLRRSGFARLRERRAKGVAAYEGPDRRKADRRSPGSQTPVLAAGLEGGWLAFEHNGAKRRLAPPPAGWESCTDQELGALWAAARVVATQSRAP